MNAGLHAPPGCSCFVKCGSTPDPFCANIPRDTCSDNRVVNRRCPELCGLCVNTCGSVPDHPKCHPTSGELKKEDCSGPRELEARTKCPALCNVCSAAGAGDLEVIGADGVIDTPGPVSKGGGALSAPLIAPTELSTEQETIAVRVNGIRPELVAQLFGPVDENGDGAISASEAAGLGIDSEMLFAAADLDSDGKLTEAQADLFVRFVIGAREASLQDSVATLLFLASATAVGSGVEPATKPLTFIAATAKPIAATTKPIAATTRPIAATTKPIAATIKPIATTTTPTLSAVQQNIVKQFSLVTSTEVALLRATADSDGDGRLTEQESRAISVPIALFQAADVNSDGELSAAEAGVAIRATITGASGTPDEVAAVQSAATAASATAPSPPKKKSSNIALFIIIAVVVVVIIAAVAFVLCKNQKSASASGAGRSNTSPARTNPSFINQTYDDAVLKEEGGQSSFGSGRGIARKNTIISAPVVGVSFTESEFGGFSDGEGPVSWTWDCREKSTAEAEALLEGQTPGTFVLRGSSSAMATLCIVNHKSDIYRRQVVEVANGSCSMHTQNGMGQVAIEFGSASTCIGVPNWPWG